MVETWHRRRDLDEPKSAYDAFCHFRDMPPGGRTIDGAYRLHRTACRKLQPRDGVMAPGLWHQWKNQFLWRERVDAYDVQVETETRTKRLAAIEAMNERHANIASVMLGKVVERLQRMVDAGDLPVGEMVKWLEKASSVERRARGEATDYVKTEHTGAVGVEHGFSARIMGSPAGVRAATELLAVLSGTAGAPGDPGGDGVAGE